MAVTLYAADKGATFDDVEVKRALECEKNDQDLKANHAEVMNTMESTG